MNKIFIPTTKPEDWRSLLADPDLHWREGYSAMNLAYRWQGADGFPDCIEQVFIESDIPLFNDLKLLIAFPEYKVPLPGGSAASQNDIFILAKGKGQLISIMVEGKGSEGFGKLVSEWYIDPSPGKKDRLYYLCNWLGVKQNEILDIRYQLLHRTVSALIEADKFNATNALMLIHSFNMDNEGFDDYSKFASIFGIGAEINKIHSLGEKRGITLFLGWASDQYNI